MFSLKHADAKARSGLLRFPNFEPKEGAPRQDPLTDGTLTPTLAIQTKGGVPEFLTSDLLAKFPPNLLAQALLFVSLGDLLEHRQLLADSPLDLASLIRTPKSLPLIVSGLIPHEFTESSVALKEVTVLTKSGKSKVSLQQYLALVKSARVNGFLTLTSQLPFNSAKKRTRGVIERTLQWRQESLKDPLIKPESSWAVIQGGPKKGDWLQAARETAKQSTLAVYVGAGTDEPSTFITDILQPVLESLPAGWARATSCSGDPIAVLRLVGEGMDMVSSNYPFLCAEMGLALVFPLRLPYADAHGEATVSLKAAVFRSQAQPLTPGCSCQCCERHTRAYLHHLLNTHEMLAHCLLALHNLHHYLSFFAEIRAAIAERRFAAYQTALTSFLQPNY